MNITKVISTTIERGRRIIKVLRYGKSDVQTSYETAPFGVDSSPIKDMRAIYSPTAERGKSVIVGYINENQIAEDGEVRLFSVDSNGNLKAYTHLKKNGTIEINGSADNMVRYSKLAVAFNELKADFNLHVSTFNAHFHDVATATAVTPGVPGISTPTKTPSTPSTANISPSKIDDVKTN